MATTQQVLIVFRLMTTSPTNVRAENLVQNHQVPGRENLVQNYHIRGQLAADDNFVISDQLVNSTHQLTPSLVRIAKQGRSREGRLGRDIDILGKSVESTRKTGPRVVRVAKQTRRSMEVGANGNVEFSNQFVDSTRNRPQSVVRFAKQQKRMEVDADGHVEISGISVDSTSKLSPSVVRDAKRQKRNEPDADGNVETSDHVINLPPKRSRGPVRYTKRKNMMSVHADGNVEISEPFLPPTRKLSPSVVRDAKQHVTMEAMDNNGGKEKQPNEEQGHFNHASAKSTDTADPIARKTDHADKLVSKAMLAAQASTLTHGEILDEVVETASTTDATTTQPFHMSNALASASREELQTRPNSFIQFIAQRNRFIKAITQSKGSSQLWMILLVILVLLLGCYIGLKCVSLSLFLYVILAERRRRKTGDASGTICSLRRAMSTM